MATSVRIVVRRLPWRLVWIVAGLEGVTVAILPYVASLPAQGPVSKPPAAGLLLGYIGMLTAILLVNVFGRSRGSERLFGGPLHIRQPLLISGWGGLYLAMIFIFQAVFDFSPDTTLTVMLRAGCSLAASTLILLLLYRASVGLLPWLALSYVRGEEQFRIVDTAIWPLVVFASLFEALALPVIERIRGIEQSRFLAGLLLGLAAGAVAAAIVVATYNLLSRRFAWGRLSMLVERTN